MLRRSSVQRANPPAAGGGGGGSYDIDATLHRFASGTGSTLISWGFTFQDGQLAAADVSKVSVWANGVAQTRYALATMFWPSGYVNVVYFQFTVSSMTNGTPLAGGIKFNDIANATSTTWTDDSAAWSNTNAATWQSSGAGLPAGVMVPTSATHACASWPLCRLTPQSGQPTFTGSATADAAFPTSVATVIDNWDGGDAGTHVLWAGAGYEPFPTLAEYQVRVGDSAIAYLKKAIAHASRCRTVYWSTYFASGVSVPFNAADSWSLLWAFRKDNGAYDGLVKQASDTLLYPLSTNFHAIDPRNVSMFTRAVTAMIRFGDSATNNMYASRTYGGTADDLVTEGLLKGATKLTSSADLPTLTGKANDGTTDVRSCMTYQAHIYFRDFRRMLDVMPSSTPKTNMVTQLLASIDAVRTAQAGTSSGGTPVYRYVDVAIWYPAVGGTLTANYTAGTTSLSIDIDSPFAGYGTGWDVSTTFSAGCVVRIGGVSKSITAQFTTNASGQATVTLEAGGFASSYSSGQAITFMRDSSANTADYETVDLNGFTKDNEAWRGYQLANSTNLDRAQAIMASAGYTPNDGHTGPYFASGAQKQWGEAWFGQEVWYWLKLAGR